MTHSDTFDEVTNRVKMSLGLWMFYNQGVPDEFASIRFKVRKDNTLTSTFYN